MLEIITGIVGSLGFPIAMCILLICFITKTLNGMQSTLDALKQTVDNNTSVVNKLNERLDRLEDHSK